MATALFLSVPSSPLLDKGPLRISSLSSHSPAFHFGKRTVSPRQRCNLCVKAENSEKPSSSSSSVTVEEREAEEKDLAVVDEHGDAGAEEERENRQEMDWKVDEEFKNFMGNPSIEAAIKLEKKRADRKLKQLDRERSDNPLIGFFNNLVRDNVSREKERLEKAEETFKALDLNKVILFFFFFNFFKSCYG